MIAETIDNTLLKIKPTCDRKTRCKPTDKNTFGLLPGPRKNGGTCSDCTAAHGGCMYISEGKKLPACYVFKTMAYSPSTKYVLEHNTKLLTKIKGEKRIKIFIDEFTRFYNSGGKYYRIHWSGDCPDLEYTCDLAAAMKAMNGKVHFWGYSRSLFTVVPMSKIPNVTWYISADSVNLKKVITFMQKLYPDVLNGKGPVWLAYMSKTKPPAVLGKMVSCPADSKQIDIENACQKCKLCIRGTSIWFKQK